MGIWVFDGDECWKGKNMGWGGRKRVGNKGRKKIRGMGEKNEYEMEKELEKGESWLWK